MTRNIFLILYLLIPTQAFAAYITVTADEYGEEWAYTVDKVEIFCHQTAVLMDAGGKRYALNGKAVGRYKGRYPNAREIAKQHPKIADPKARMPPPPGLIQRGFNLCK